MGLRRIEPDDDIPPNRSILIKWILASLATLDLLALGTVVAWRLLTPPIFLAALGCALLFALLRFWRMRR